jgi:hypothetical protein
MAIYDECDATLRFNIIVEIIRSRGEVEHSDWVPIAEKVYEFVTRTGNSPALKQVDDEIPF